MNKSELQAIFNYIVEGLAKQGGPSIANYSCLYRGPGGRKCAIGQLILDDHYNENLEGKNIFNDEVFDAVKISWRLTGGAEITSDQGKFLKDIQICHDMAENENNRWTYVWHAPYGIAHSLYALGNRLGLDISVVKKSWPGSSRDSNEITVDE